MAGEGNSVRYSAVPRRAWLFRSLDLAAPECDVHRVGLGIVCDVGHGFRLAFRSNVALIWHRHSGARVKRANPESRDSPMCSCTSGVWSFGPSRNDASAIDLQRGNKRFLRDVDLAELPHLLLASFCF